MTNDEKILAILEKHGKALENLQAGQERLEKGQQTQGAAIETLQADVKDMKHTQQEQGAEIKQQGSVIHHIATAIKALATKQDVERLEKEVDIIKKRLWPHRAE